MEIIREGWISVNESADHVSIMDRMASCRKALTRWKRSSISNSLTRIKRIKEIIEKEGAKLFPELL